MKHAGALSIKKSVAESLVRKGWTVVSDFDMAHTIGVATKDYDTVVGVKTAHASLEPRAEGAFLLLGRYESEGRNVLSTIGFKISPGLNSEAIDAGTERFARKVEAAVEQSYARRLLTPAKDAPGDAELTSSILEFVFRLGPKGQPYPDMDDHVSELDYQLTHDLIEGTEIIAVDAGAGQLTVSARLHQQVNEATAQDMACSLEYGFRTPDTQAEHEAEMLSVEFPRWM